VIAAAAKAYLDSGVTIRFTQITPHASLPHRYSEPALHNNELR
jgi:hypothetical protein